MSNALETLPALRIAAPLFGVALVGCGLGGAISAAAFVAWTFDIWVRLSGYEGLMAVALWAFCSVLAAPLNVVILPLTCAGFRRS